MEKARDLESSLNQVLENQRKCSKCQIATVDLISLDMCKHQFCNQCLIEHLTRTIKEHSVKFINCPNHGCISLIQEQKIEKLVSPELFEKYKRKRHIEEFESSIVWCPKPDCEGFVKVPEEFSSEIRKLDCNVCGAQFCSNCREDWHENATCNASNLYTSIKLFYVDGEKLCPDCKTRVEKLNGDHDFTCFKCKSIFCWLCENKMYGFHYDSCEALTLTKDPHWAITLILLFAPLLLLFSLLIFLFMGIYNEEIFNFFELDLEKLNNLIRKYRKTSCFVAVLLGIILFPLFFVFVSLVVSVMLTFDIILKNTSINRCSGKTCYNIFGFFLGLLLSPLIMVFFVIGSVVAHILGIFTLIWKGYVGIRRCKNPGFMKSNT